MMTNDLSAARMAHREVVRRRVAAMFLAVLGPPNEERDSREFARSWSITIDETSRCGRCGRPSDYIWHAGHGGDWWCVSCAARQVAQWRAKAQV